MIRTDPVALLPDCRTNSRQLRRNAREAAAVARVVVRSRPIARPKWSRGRDLEMMDGLSAPDVITTRLVAMDLPEQKKASAAKWQDAGQGRSGQSIPIGQSHSSQKIELLRIGEHLRNADQAGSRTAGECDRGCCQRRASGGAGRAQTALDRRASPLLSVSMPISSSGWRARAVHRRLAGAGER